jgi:copper chaperone CopZ
MDCEGCAQTIEHSLKRIEGVREVRIDWQKGDGEVAFDPDQTDEQAILDDRIFSGGYTAALAREGA